MRTLAALICLLTFTASASAQGAWVLWMMGSSSPWDAVGTFSTREQCVEAMHQQAQAVEKTGLGEAVALRWSDVDLDGRVILVRRSQRRGRVSEPKSGKARRVDMSEQLAVVLRGHKSLQAAEAALRGQELLERVFSTTTGQAVADDGFRNHVWTPILRRAELRYRKPHTLRHTYASLLIDGGEPITYVQHQLGHSSPTITLKVYAHLMPRTDRRAVDSLDDAPAAPIRKPRATDGSQDTVTTREDVPPGQRRGSDTGSSITSCRGSSPSPLMCTWIVRAGRSGRSLSAHSITVTPSPCSISSSPRSTSSVRLPVR